MNKNSSEKYGILTDAVIDPSVEAILCDRETIRLKINDAFCDYIDDNGKAIQFSSVEQQERVLQALMCDESSSLDFKTISTTPEGHRLRIIDDKCLSQNVCRRFTLHKIGLAKKISPYILSNNMAKMLNLIVDGELNFFIVGEIASGKSTLHDALIKSSPASKSFVMVDNATEALDIQENTTVCVEEMRSSEEFACLAALAASGHPVSATYHSADATQAVWRFANCLSVHESTRTVHNLQKATNLIDAIVVMKRLSDGSRKIVQISEVCGCIGSFPLIHDIYVFDSASMAHRRVNPVSKKLANKLRAKGIPESDFAFLLTPIDESDKETYAADALNFDGSNQWIRIS